MRVLVVDDEAPARRRLVRKLAEIDGVEIVGEAEDGLDALEKVRALAPDLLLLDVRMPGLDGIALASRDEALPPVVFVTAYDEFAVQAFELEAIDYLLKPVRTERLVRAIERARIRLGREPVPSAPADESLPRTSPRVVTSERGAVRYFDARAVTRFWAADKYTLFRTDDGEHVTVEPLNDLAERLAPYGFQRVHRGELINLAHVRTLHTSESGDASAEVELDDGQVARVSRRALTALKARLVETVSPHSARKG